MENQFLKTVLEAQENLAFTENGAVSYKTSGSKLADQFGKAGSAFGRDIDLVFAEQEALWNENPEMALRFPFYLRMITRKVKSNGASTETLQKGPGVRDEAFKRLLWIEKNHPDAFYRNLWVLPLVGSYKDIWTLLSMSENPETNEYFKVLINGLNDPDARDLVIKYMPRIRSNSKCSTDSAKKFNELAKSFSKALGFRNYEEYRKFKASGKAHIFQQLITNRDFMHIDWSSIPGKALQNIVNSKFLSNHGIEESYMTWMLDHDDIKYNGSPVEIMLGYRKSNSQSSSARKISRLTADRQFNSLINKVRSDGKWDKNVLCGLDTSGSMTWVNLNSRGIQPLDVCLSLGVYVSELNTGTFHNHVAMFDDHSRMTTLSGTFSEKCDQLMRMSSGGGTNFQSLVDLICSTRKKHPEIPLEDFPTTLLVVSDMQFNSCSYYYPKSNVETSRAKLMEAFPKEWAENFKFIWWNCVERGQADVPATLDDKGSYMLSGYDGSIISLLTGMEQKAEDENKVQPTMEDLIYEALNQEVLQLVK